jgi:hypothetical protein
MNYKARFGKLVKSAKEQGLKVKVVKDEDTLDYVGMNDLAAKDFGLNIPDKTIYIDRSKDWGLMCRTLKHELDEREDMAKGSSYWKAHSKALKTERRLK